MRVHSSIHTHTSICTYVYMYVYTCVCVCCHGYSTHPSIMDIIQFARQPEHGHTTTIYKKSALFTHAHAHAHTHTYTHTAIPLYQFVFDVILFVLESPWKSYAGFVTASVCTPPPPPHFLVTETEILYIQRVNYAPSREITRCCYARTSL